MKILHISDLHFESIEKNEYSLTRILARIVEEAKNSNITYILFTGDLVQKGDNYDDFLTVKKIVMDRLGNELNVEAENIFFCCGNHDVHRGQETSLITDHISKFNSEKDLDMFFSSKVEQSNYDNSLLNIKNFINFQKSYYQDFKSSNVISDLYSIHEREFDGRKICIVTLNSSWRSTDSEKDFGNLMFPNVLLEKISNATKDIDFKILLIHHPLAEFRYWNKTLIENKIFENFHLMVLGHIHKGIQSTVANNEEGLIVSSSTAVLSKVNDYEKIGFAILDVNIELKEIDFKTFNIDSEFICYTTNEIKLNIPTGGQQKEYIELRKKITALYLRELENANDLFINNAESGKGFFQSFSTPVLKNKSVSEIKSIKRSNSNDIKIDDLVISQGSKAIYGKDKCGKTIILHYIYLKQLDGFSILKKIPLYIDANKANSIKNFSIDRLLKNQYELTLENFAFLKANYQLVLLIDDISRLEEEVRKNIENYINDNPLTIVYVTEDENLIQHSNIQLDSLDFEKVFIHELTSKGVRELAKSTLNCTDEISGEILVKIKFLFKQLNLNFNFWTVSLFMWIYNKEDSLTFRNNFELIQLYIDNLLDRATIVKEKSLDIEYRQLKEFLSDLAAYLVIKKYDNGYHLEYEELVEFVKNYKTENSRFIINTEDLLNLIITKGILKSNRELNGMYSFRLKGVFEYFIATHMSENPETTDQIMSEKGFYLSFANEWELYAGLKEKDEDFVNKIFKITKEYFSDLNADYKNVNTDSILIKKIGGITEVTDSKFKQVLKSQIETDTEMIDELTDSKAMIQSVTKKEFKEMIKNADQLEKALFIMCRVYRNTGLKNKDLENEILNFILESACNLSFLIIDENIDQGEQQSSVLTMFKKFAPMVVQNFLFEAMAQDNLKLIFENKIKELRKEEGNELKLFALYFILIDLDFNANKKYISEITSIAKQNVIKYAILYKLYNYLIFNKTSDKAFLKRSLLDQQRKINNSKDAIDNLQKNFSQFERMSVAMKSKDE